MEKAAQEFEAARKEMREVRDELAKRPTRKQIGWVLVAVVAAILGLGAIGFLVLQSYFSTSDTAETADAVKQSQEVQGCRAIVRSKLIDTATSERDAARDIRDQARDQRDNLTNEAVQAAAEGDDQRFAVLSAQAAAKRQAVIDTNNDLLTKAAALDKAVEDYQDIVVFSNRNPEGFLAVHCPSE